ncbi:hypothetical protein FisN_4Lh444 [Fistulifera solaris]|uniref:Uncharacterized protein n=1 Tax=Fistulifera solaris TaxID=1519565 RepID=A0A1Z5KDM8_FISSO|nr:hypothetical protein FisN_4Lh444 [Fistulifera solaris]|eukprot:GAX24327.1 hypothetical protein FisN_4Lh444 [Fistulifera solaris]
MKATGRSQYRCLVVSILSVSTFGSNDCDPFLRPGNDVSFPRLYYSLQHPLTENKRASRYNGLKPGARISEARNRVGENLRALVSQLTLSDSPEARSHSNESNKDTNFPSSGKISINNGPKSPLAYRYYARNPKLSHTYGSLPFLLIGPNIDHWKVVARELASRGYNVIVCERVGLEEFQKKKTQWTQHDSTILIQSLLDALKWNTVVMIACDEEAVLAVEAAMNLASERISALILCGRIPQPEGFWKEYSPLMLKRGLAEYDSIDEILQDNLRCPFSIVWDGAIPPPPETETRDAFSQSDLPTRNLILGGGSAPHRRRPELFAWSMTRFVEKNLATRTSWTENEQSDRSSDREVVDRTDVTSFMAQMSELFNPESFVVGGRLIATAILYVALLRTLAFQYGRIRWATINVSSAVRMVFTFPVTVVRGILNALGQVKKGKSTLINVCCAAFGYLRSILSRQHHEVVGEDEGPDISDDQKDQDIEVESEQPLGQKQNEDGDEIDEPDSETDSGDSSPEQTHDEKRRKRIPRPYFYLDNVIV